MFPQECGPLSEPQGTQLDNGSSWRGEERRSQAVKCWCLGPLCLIQRSRDRVGTWGDPQHSGEGGTVKSQWAVREPGQGPADLQLPRWLVGPPISTLRPLPQGPWVSGCLWAAPLDFSSLACLLQLPPSLPFFLYLEVTLPLCSLLFPRSYQENVINPALPGTMGPAL